MLETRIADTVTRNRAPTLPQSKPEGRSQFQGPSAFEHSGDKIDLLKWLIDTARARNSNIKIFAQQWWTDSASIPNVAWMLLDMTHINTYAASVAVVMKQYELDGYDVDYESGNYVREGAAILAAVRAELDALSKNEKRPLYLTLSAAHTEFLKSDTHAISKSIDWSWIGLGFPSTRLTYGIMPETAPGTMHPGDDYSPTMTMVQEAFTSHNLGGINLWRLTSGNYIFSSQVQVLIHNFLHKSTLKDSPDPAQVEKLLEGGT